MQHFSIKSRLIFVISFLSALLIGIGSYGLAGISQVNASLQTVYEDRLVAAGQLDQVARALLRLQLGIALSDDVATAREQFDGIKQDLENERQQ